MEEIVILVASLPELTAKGHPWIFSDRHALMDYAEFHNDLGSLSCLDWVGLKARDFSRDPERPGKLERYQAEALIHKHLPLAGLSGVVCHGAKQEEKLKLILEAGGVRLPVAAKPDWYFR